MRDLLEGWGYIVVDSVPRNINQSSWLRVNTWYDSENCISYSDKRRFIPVGQPRGSSIHLCDVIVGMDATLTTHDGDALFRVTTSTVVPVEKPDEIGAEEATARKARARREAEDQTKTEFIRKFQQALAARGSL